MFVYRKLNTEYCMNNKSVNSPFDEVEMVRDNLLLISLFYCTG